MDSYTGCTYKIWSDFLFYTDTHTETYAQNSQSCGYELTDMGRQSL